MYTWGPKEIYEVFLFILPKVSQLYKPSSCESRPAGPPTSRRGYCCPLLFFPPCTSRRLIVSTFALRHLSVALCLLLRQGLEVGLEVEVWGHGILVDCLRVSCYSSCICHAGPARSAGFGQGRRTYVRSAWSRQTWGSSARRTWRGPALLIVACAHTPSLRGRPFPCRRWSSGG